jgi:hypothetical protein
MILLITDSHSQQFLSLLSSSNLYQHVDFPTHVHDNTLDLVITSDQSISKVKLSCKPATPSDHFLMLTHFDVAMPPAEPLIVRQFRRISSINTENFSF